MTEAERAAIAAAADRQERERYCRILTSPDGVKVNGLAQHLAFETDLRADEALPILAIARGAIDAAATASEPDNGQGQMFLPKSQSTVIERTVS